MNKDMNLMIGAVLGGATTRALGEALAKEKVEKNNTKTGKSNGKKDNDLKAYMPMLTGLGIGMLGTYATKSLPRKIVPIVNGMSFGALGITGAELMDFVTKKGRFVEVKQAETPAPTTPQTAPPETERYVRRGYRNFNYAPIRSAVTAPVAGTASTVPLEI